MTNTVRMIMTVIDAITEMRDIETHRDHSAHDSPDSEYPPQAAEEAIDIGLL